MAKTKFALDFKGFLDFARQVDELGEGYLKKATENALQKSKDYANKQVEKALKDSPYNFYQGRSSKHGVGGIASPTGGNNQRASGRTKKSAHEVGEMPLEWNGNSVKGYVGVSWYDAPEIIFLAYGTPHISADKNLQNAIKVKGKYRKEVDKIQMEEFQKVINEGMNNG